MSILLEALKKSQHARQLGETPTLDSQLENTSSADESSMTLIPVLLIVLSSLVMVWFGWQQFQEPEMVDATGDEAVVSTRERPAPEPSARAGDAPRTPTENFVAEEPVESDSVTDLATDADDRRELRQSFRQYAAEDPADSEGGDPEGGDPEGGDSRPDPGDLARDVEEAMPVAAEPRERRADPGLEPHEAEPISFWELPQNVRDNMPEIRITVLVYAEQPEDRFLLANGQRLAEKDELEGGVVLDEIRREGAVFTYRKYRFLVKG